MYSIIGFDRVKKKIIGVLVFFEVFKARAV